MPQVEKVPAALTEESRRRSLAEHDGIHRGAAVFTSVCSDVRENCYGFSSISKVNSIPVFDQLDPTVAQ